MTPSAVIARHLFPGARVVVADGAGMPLSLLAPLAEAAQSVGDVSLVLGWCLAEPEGIDGDAFREVRTFMGGFGLRGAVDRGAVMHVPTRLRSVPALLSGPLKPDLLLAAWRSAPDGGWTWGSEVSWMQSLVDDGVPVVIESNEGLPRASREGPLPEDRATVATEVDRPPLAFRTADADEVARAVAGHILPWIPEGSALQYGPSPVCDALLDALDRPVHVRSGMVTDAVVRLSDRGLLLGDPQGAYVAGTEVLYAWADGRPIATRVERTHAVADPADPPLVAVNLALEVDRVGQVNVESLSGRHISGIGGHPDFARLGAVDPRGLSIVALPSRRGGRSTRVSALSGPVSTPRYDVDVFVTEAGAVDVRGLSDAERAEALDAAWPG